MMGEVTLHTWYCRLEYGSDVIMTNMNDVSSIAMGWLRVFDYSLGVYIQGLSRLAATLVYEVIYNSPILFIQSQTCLDDHTMQ